MTFPYKWYLKDGYPAKGIEKNGLKVFSCFACGGGSTMGYKLAGYDVIGCNEIDKQIIDVYKLNHKPKFAFNEDIRTFRLREDLPEELFNLDILDGSPPCSSFSMAGNREKDWGKEKVFREGQALQTLDDLFFDFIALAGKLKPKAIIAENVKGLIQGNAKGYVKQINQELNKIGYSGQIFLFNAASMGVPQKRERVFFIYHRNDLELPQLRLRFNEKPVLFGEYRQKGEGEKITGKALALWDKKRFGDMDLAQACEREFNQRAYFGSKLQYDNEVCFTIIGSESSPIIKYSEPLKISNNELKMSGTFPMDYNFSNVKPKYLIGMSVPPVMTAQIARQIYLQWFSYGKT